MNKKIVAYLRVSTEAQTEKYGLDLQKQKILDYCKKNAVIIDDWYIDGGYSGSKLDRPQMQRLLNDAGQGFISTVYVYKLDRLSRDTADTLELMHKTLPKFGVEVVSMSEDIRNNNPMDKVMLTMNAAMNQYERETIRQRMTDGMIERVKKGYWMGGGRVPFGYRYDRNDGILHPIPEQTEIVRKLFQLYIDGYSCDKISKMLGFKGEKIVMNILKRKSNIGLIEYKGEVYQGLHEPIIDEETFYKAQDCIKKRSTNSFVSNDHILTGLCWCGECGARMRYHKWDAKQHRLLCYSQVKGKEYMQRDRNCQNVHPIAKKIENEVEHYFKQFIIKLENEEIEVKNNINIIKDTINKTTKEIKRLYDLFSKSETDALLEVIQQKENLLKELENDYKIELESSVELIPKKIEEIKRVADVWDDLNNKEKNKILKQCIEKVVITGDDVAIHFNLH